MVNVYCHSTRWNKFHIWLFIQWYSNSRIIRFIKIPCSSIFYKLKQNPDVQSIPQISMLLFATWDNEPLLFWPNFFLLLIVHLLLILTHMCSSFYGEKFELTYGLLVCIYMWHSLGNESDVSCCNSMQSWNLKLKDFLSKYIFICINLFTFWRCSTWYFQLYYIILY